MARFVEGVSPASSIMGQNFTIVNRSRATMAWRVMRLILRVARRLLRVLLRRPLIDILLLLFVLYLIASLIGSFNQPRPLLYPAPPTVFEGR
jgi:hypothetical protein